MPNRHHGPPKRRLPMTWHTHNNHTPPLHAHPRLRHRDSAAPTGGFTTIDTPPRRVAGVSQPYGRNSPHAPTHNRQPRAYSRPSHDQTQPPTLANGGFYYHRHPATACRRRVTPLWSQFPPRTHPQPPTTHPPTTASHTPTHNRQPRHHSRPSHDQTQPPTHTNRGFYYHRHPATACRRRVTALWSQFPPRTHPQPPTTPPQQAQPRPNTAANPHQRGVLLP